MRDLRPLLAPASVAILGASSRPNALAGMPLRNLQALDYAGPILPVNPAREEIGGLPCYPSVEALPMTPELALILVPAPAVVPAVEACAARGVRAMIVISAGFAETGAEGAAAQARLSGIARASGTIVCGPNSIGVLNYVERIALTFAAAAVTDMTRAPAGRVGFVSQSGGLLTALGNRATDLRAGVSRGISTGNEADLTVSEALEWLAADPATDAVVAIIESVRDGTRFLAACDALLAADKPLIALKVGRAAAGAAAARSHTGALAGSYAAFQAVLRARGVIEAHDVDDLFPLAAAAVAGKRPAGPRLAVLTESGGAGGLAADTAVELGLELASLDGAAARLRAYLPGFAADVVANPFDPTAMAIENPAAAGEVAAVLLDDPAVDAVVMIAPGSGEGGRRRGEAVAAAAQASAKPLHGVVLAGTIAEPMHDVLRAANVPVFRSPSRAVTALAGLRQFARLRARRQDIASAPVTAEHAARVRQLLHALGDAPIEYDAMHFLASFGVPTVPQHLAHTADDAAAHARILGYPVVLKVQSPDIVHKTEAGGVRLGLLHANAVRAAYHELLDEARRAQPTARLAGVLVARQVPVPLELIAGFHTDPQFGPLVVFGLGGLWVEVFNDVALRPAPLLPDDALDMLDELRAAPLLRGARGLPPVRPAAVQALLLALSRLAVESVGLLAGVDINPLVPTPDGDLLALDASLFLAPAG